MDRLETQLSPGDRAEMSPGRRPLMSWVFPSNRKIQHLTPVIWGKRALEATIFCLAALAFSMWLEPIDPFQIHTGYPWVWIMPAVIAMRYGTSVGIWSVTVILVSWLGMYRYGFPSRLGNEVAAFPEAYFVGGLAMTMICGQFADTWIERHRRVIAANGYFNERLQMLTREHYLLRLSHEKLERDMLVKPLTLRESLTKLRNIVHASHNDAERMPGAGELLQLLVQSCQLEVATIFLVDADGRLEAEPRAVLGTPSAMDPSDPLLRTCLENRRLAHLHNSQIGKERQQSSKYLVCLPMCSVSGRLYGVVAVESMPFSALNKATLQMMAVMVGYYTDGLEQEGATAGIYARVPGCPNDFSMDLVKLCRIHNTAGIESSLVAFVFENNASGTQLYENIKRIKRSIDMSCTLSNARRKILIALLPLSNQQAAHGYLSRVEESLHELSGKNFPSAHVLPYVARLGATSAVDNLVQLLERCDA